MKEHAIRLTKGQDLKEEIIKYSKKQQIKAGIIVCCVGSVSEINIRLAGAKSILNKKEQYEVVSITGTICLDDVHIHISFSDKKGNFIGGHLKNGCIIDTTAEIVVLELSQYTFSRVFDENTGYNELFINSN